MTEQPSDNDGRVSLAPLTPQDALKALLAVRPDDKREPPVPEFPDDDAEKVD